MAIFILNLNSLDKEQCIEAWENENVQAYGLIVKRFDFFYK